MEDEDLQISFNVSLPRISCEYASVDLNNILGTHKVNLTKNVRTFAPCALPGHCLCIACASHAVISACGTAPPPPAAALPPPPPPAPRARVVLFPIVGAVTVAAEVLTAEGDCLLSPISLVPSTAPTCIRLAG
jgi:hypothetical protein